KIPKTFVDIGVDSRIAEICESLGWKEPTEIQREAIPVALTGHDIIGLAETGSGKTAAFTIPIMQALLNNPQRLFALIITPTRELAIQIHEQIVALGVSFQIKCAVLVGGMDMMAQAVALAKKPHIIIATPGRLIDHLEKTKGFNLRSLKYLVLDEADRILNMDFEREVDKILEQIPKTPKPNTYLYSATMTKKVAKLQRASLKDPVRIEVSSKYQTVDHLQQYYTFIPAQHKDIYLVYILRTCAAESFMVFCNTCTGTQKLALVLRNLGFSAIPLNGKMTQTKRLASLNKFKVKSRSILIATDVASRGLDIPHVDVVINYDLPQHSKDYIHRVGRTARAGRYGKSITIVTQYDVELYQRIEHLIDKKLPAYDAPEEKVMLEAERVADAERVARVELSEMDDKSKRNRNDDDDEAAEDEVKQFRKKLKRKKKEFKSKKFKARRVFRIISNTPSRDLAPPTNPEACTKTASGIPLNSASLSSLTPRHSSFNGMRDMKDLGAKGTAAALHESCIMAVPIKGVYRELTGPFHGQVRNLDGTLVPCADMHLNLMECWEAYGYNRGQSICRSFFTDYAECAGRWKATMRINIMRLERAKQVAKDELSKTMGTANKATQIHRNRRSSRSNSGCSGSEDESSACYSTSLSHHLSKRVKTELTNHSTISNHLTSNERLAFHTSTLNLIDRSRIYNNDNRKKPAELFRKDLISAMKMADSEQLAESDYILITDPWKEEWEKGVQVPVYPDALPSASFRCVHGAPCISDSKASQKNNRNPTITDKRKKEFQKEGDPQLPREWIKDRRKPPDQFKYELDLIDLTWRELMAQTCVPPIPEHLIEDTITELERQCAENMKNNKIGIEFDDGVVCDVCRSPYSEEGNEMIFCDRCEVCIHQACYDIEEIPEGQWYCQPCKELGKSDKASCILCPNKRGAMKKTPENTWAHVSCSLWVASQIDGDHKDAADKDKSSSRSSSKQTGKKRPFNHEVTKSKKISKFKSCNLQKTATKKQPKRSAAPHSKL
ncbi:putative ATP-dependent RNA helicase DDX47, partial [Fragariocoptes setiger]